ncbi:MAG TPA: S1 RNA-binding domain-containing protein [Polyangiaceae bacterium]|jgi:small subunit ribosomal protein S1|nr:S1 RNA-binding domain-containing protein [Polyangiaceae bacterium]
MSSDRPDESFAALFEKAGAGAPRKRNPRIGETLDAVVVQVGKDAVFVELDGRRQGFIESIDLKGPDGEIKAAAGDRLRVRVVSVDPEAGVRLAPTVEAAVAAGASVTLGAPAGEAAGPAAVTVAVGQVISGVVDRIENYGLFVQIDGTRGRAGRGLLPVAELGVPRGTDLRKVFPVGTKIKAKILEIGEGKMRLSARALKDDEERAQFDGFREQEKKAPAAQGFGTLGDLTKLRKSK